MFHFMLCVLREIKRKLTAGKDTHDQIVWFHSILSPGTLKTGLSCTKVGLLDLDPVFAVFSSPQGGQGLWVDFVSVVVAFCNI